MDWARILAYVTGMVDQELLARNEYLAAENRILKAQLKGRWRPSLKKKSTSAPSPIWRPPGELRSSSSPRDESWNSRTLQGGRAVRSSRMHCHRPFLVGVANRGL
jgi:hypothetical protein